MTTNSLLVFALEQEACNLFADDTCLYTGVGKVNAAYHLTKYLALHGKPELIINLGSAGSRDHPTGCVVHCTRFIQRDMDVTPLGFQPYQTPFSDMPQILAPKGPETRLPEGICGTGDHFDIAHDTDEYDIVDMEAYALGHICYLEDIPFLCLKFISDGADDQAHLDWEQALEQGAHKLRQSLKSLNL
jgi:adenosylhomocysteine nucleosidase